MLAQADIAHRQTELIADGQHDAALGGAIHLGQDDAGHTQ